MARLAFPDHQQGQRRSIAEFSKAQMNLALKACSRTSGRQSMRRVLTHAMPERAQRPCRECGTRTPNASGYCDAHQNDNRRTRQREDYDKRRADDPFRKFRNLALWHKQIQPAILRRDPLCKICNRAASTVADHIVPARLYCANGGSFWDKLNLQGLCKPCHDRKTATEDSNFAGTNS